jgi:uncharacterized membrane protein
MMETAIQKNRIQSIDILRGLVMVIMALDHVRDFFYKADMGKAGDVAMDPTNLQTTFPMLFFTRWVTHFCAPSFIFLAGTSIYLMCLQKPKKELSLFLIKRGAILVILEVTIITFGWTFNPFYNLFILQVIWAIGMSMILLGMIIRLPYKMIFSVGLIIVAGHNLLDFPSINSGLKGSVIAELFYFANFSFHALNQNHFVIIIYSFLPWTGVMLLGFCFGKLFEPEYEPERRKKTLIQLGSSIILFFVILRFTNLYGDPVPWSVQPRGVFYTVFSFINLNKYPPSLLFLCMTIGPGMLFLAFIEKIQNKFTDIMNVYGKVPMLFYVLHFYLIHTFVVFVFYIQGFGSADIISPNNPFFFKPNGFGFGLWGVYAVWAIVIMILFPVCKKYGLYKNSHHQWWLSYL